LPFGLDVEATEKQNAQDHDDGYQDYLDQSHGKFLKVVGQERNKCGYQTTRILRSALVSCQTPAGASQSPNDGFQPRVPIGNTSRSKRRFNLFEPEAQTPAKQPRIANVRSTEHRLEVVEKQLVRNVLDVKLDIH